MTQNPAAQAVLAFIVVAVVALIGLWGLGAAAADVGETDELSATVEQRNDTYQAVAAGDTYDRYAIPTVSNDSGTLTENRDYWWNNSDGTIVFNETVLDPDPNSTYENATVNVTAIDLPAQAATIVSALEPLYRLPAWLVLILGPTVVLYGLWQLHALAGTRRRGPA